MKPILKDHILNQQLSRDGYVVLPFLTDDEVIRLKDFYYRYHPSRLEGMYATAHVSDIDMRIEMNNYIKEIFSRAIEDTLIHIEALGGSFIAKGKGENGTLKPHQDWNIVDEDLYRSFNIWVPLVDLKADNGAICIMSGSHLWIKSFRSANIHSVYQPVEDELWGMMSKMYMKAGEALIYDHRLIHASEENKTDEIRLAAVFGVIPEGADMMYYHRKDANTVEVYESNKEFFLYENIFEGPKNLKKIGAVNYRSPVINSQKLHSLERKNKTRIVDRIMRFFSLSAD